MFFKLGSTVESVMSTFTTDGVGPAASAASTCIRAGPASRGRTKIEARRYFFMMLTCFRFSGPKIAGKFQFSGATDSGRWTRKDHEAIEVHGGADCLHPATS